MARIHAVGRGVVILDVNKIHKGWMRHRAVIAFEKIIDHVLPVCLYFVGKPMGKFELGQIFAITLDVACQRARLFGQRRCKRIKIDENKSAVLLKLDRF